MSAKPVREHFAHCAGNSVANRRSGWKILERTNYEKLQPGLDLIAAWAPELVIVDGAQRVKNWNTIAARALKRIDSPYAVVLTSTPLENKRKKLISIVQFVDQRDGAGNGATYRRRSLTGLGASWRPVGFRAGGDQ